MKAKLTLATMAALAALGTPALQAQQTWDGDSDTTFATGANWVSGTAPTNSTLAANTATFGATVTSNQPNLTANRSVGGLIFQSATGGWTLSGTGTTLTVGSAGISDSATSGVTNIDPTIAAGATRAYGTSGGTLNLNGGLAISGAAVANITGNVVFSSLSVASDAQTFSKGGAGTLTITGAATGSSGATWSGNITFSSGTLILGNTNALGSGSINWSGTSTLQASSNLSGANAMTNNFTNGPGTKTVSGSNNITLNGSFTNANTGAAIVSSITSGNLFTLGGNVFLSDVSGTGRTLTISGTGNTTISGNIANFNGSGTAGNLTIENTGVTTLSGNNTYSGTTTATAPGVQLLLGHQNAFGTSSVVLASNTPSNLVTVAASTNLSGANAVAVNAMTLNNITVVGSNDLTFNGTITGGGAGAAVTWTNNLDSDKVWEIAGTTYINSSSNAKTINIVGTGNTSISANISNWNGALGSGAITLNGTSTSVLVLSGTNTYTGATTVTAGTLLVNGTQAAGSNVSVAGGAEFGRSVLSALSLGATTTFADNSRIVLALDAGLTHASLNRTGGTWVFDADQSFRFLNLGGATSGIYTGIITGLTGSEAGLASIGTWSIANAGWTGTFSYSAGSVDLNLTVIPEPSTWALLAVGLTAMVVMRRRRRA